MESNLEISTARMKSYTGAAIFVFLLYWFFYLPGVIANYLYLQEARVMEERAGTSLPGVWLLSAMMWGSAAFSAIVLLTFCFVSVWWMSL